MGPFSAGISLKLISFNEKHLSSAERKMKRVGTWIKSQIEVIMKIFSQAMKRTKFWRQHIFNVIKFSLLLEMCFLFMRKGLFESSKLADKFYIQFIIFKHNQKLFILHIKKVSQSTVSTIYCSMSWWRLVMID